MTHPPIVLVESGLSMFTKIDHKFIKRLEELVRTGKLTTANEIVLLLTISRFGWGKAEKRNPCKKSIKSLTQLLGCSESSIKRALRKLNETNLIDRHYRTRIPGETEKTTTRWPTVEARLKNGAKQLRSYYYLRDKGIIVNVKIHKV